MRKLSIICTTFNSAQTLQKTIDSIKYQTFTDFEFIIVDGRSTDSTLDIIADNSEVVTKTISESDRSIFDAMNKGILAASGEWIFFIGSDDYLENETVLEKMLSPTISEEVGIIIGNVEYSNGKVFKSQWNWKLLLFCSVHHQSAFYRRRLFENNLYFPEKNNPSDYGHNLGLYMAGIKHKYINVTVSIYALGGDSSQVLWTRYSNEIKLRNEHVDSVILRSLLGFQTWLRFTVKRTLQRFSIDVYL